MRRIASVVFASAALAGGLAAGPASAIGSLDDSVQGYWLEGSSDIPKEGLSDYRPFGSNWAGPGCFDGRGEVSNVQGNMHLCGHGDWTMPAGAEAYPGGTITTSFGLGPGDVAGVDRLVTKITVHAPAGYEYDNRFGDAYLNGVDYSWNRIQLVPELSANGSTATFTMPDGGRWVGLGKGIGMMATFRVPTGARVGSAADFGLTFEGSGFDGPQGWQNLTTIPIGPPFGRVFSGS
ncbi:hypothetical protein [Rhodococcus oryzae]|uniref:hypothetical protein n=1 Tax=Rhodococcus oryzae TaxID=2571143 RepID=UPI00379373B1